MNNQDDRDTLLPCPFCGGGVELHGRGNGWTIECYNCNVSMNIIDAPSVIVKQWNCRQHFRTATLDEVDEAIYREQPYTPAEATKVIDNLRGESDD